MRSAVMPVSIWAAARVWLKTLASTSKITRYSRQEVKIQALTVVLQCLDTEQGWHVCNICMDSELKIALIYVAMGQSSKLW